MSEARQETEVRRQRDRGGAGGAGVRGLHRALRRAGGRPTTSSAPRAPAVRAMRALGGRPVATSGPRTARECVWGRVLAFQPPRRVLLAWADRRPLRATTRTRRTPPRSRCASRRRDRRAPGSSWSTAASERHGDTWEPALARVGGRRRTGGWILERSAAAADSVSGIGTVAPVRASVTVAAPVEKAWRVYTEDYGSWYPKGHFIGVRPGRDGGLRAVRGRPVVRAGARTAPSCCGAGCWPGSRRTGCCWPGWSTATGSATPTRRRRPRSRSGSPPRARTGPGSSWSTATSSGTAPAPASILGGVSDQTQGHPLYLRRFAAAAEGRPIG